jgi:hypothetical protein
MATWVVYHDSSKPESLEYVINDVPAGTKKEDIMSALSVSNEGCLVTLGTEITHSHHGVCMLDDAPEATQAKNADGKASKILRWRDIWTPTSTPR